MSWNEEGDVGCFLEVDLSIPRDLHDKFNCYPIIPEPLDITDEMISTTSKNIREKRSAKSVKFSSKNLATNL